MRLAPLAVGFCLVSCASRPAAIAVPVPPAGVVDTAALTAAGCYRCLEEAFTAASSRGDARAAFEAAVLLALRSKELGLPPDAWIERARERMPAGAEWATYLDVAIAYPRDPIADDRNVLMSESAERRRPREVYREWQGAVRTGTATPIFRTYLDLAVACRPDVWVTDTPQVLNGAVLRATEGPDVPLIRYRIGLCGGRDAGELVAALAAEPRFVDAELELGRRERQRQPRPDIAAAFRRLGRAAEAFPESAVVHGTLARLHEDREQWAEALREWDAVLAIVPRHGDALIGRTMMLSQLLRHEEAVAVATRTLEVAPTHRSSAFYWRAWNLFQLQRFTDARADADAAKALSVNPSLFLLSGMIEWELKRPESAEKEFLEVLIIDFGVCEASSYLGGVRLELRTWPESLAAFEQARNCYQLAMTLRRQAIMVLSASPDDETANAFEIRGHQRALAAAERRHGEAVQNIAALQKFLSGTR